MKFVLVGGYDRTQDSRTKTCWDCQSHYKTCLEGGLYHNLVSFKNVLEWFSPPPNVELVLSEVSTKILDSWKLMLGWFSPVSTLNLC